MKKSIILTTLIIISLIVKAQEIAPIHIGPLLGGTLSFPGAEINDSENTTRQQLGGVAGVFARIKMGSYYLQPELQYNSSRFKVNVTPNPPQFGTPKPPFKLRGSITTFDIPVILGRYFLDAADIKVRINAGPVVSFRLKNFFDASASAVAVDYQKNAKSIIWALAVGAGADISRFAIDTRYYYQFGQPISNDEFKLRYDLLTLTVAYKLL